MDSAEFERAKTLLSLDALMQLDEIQPKKWVVTNEQGICGLFDRKQDAWDEMLARHLQTRENSQAYRNGEGAYLICILDPKQPSKGELYITYRIVRITKQNLLYYQTLKLQSLLPRWLSSADWRCTSLSALL